MAEVANTSWYRKGTASPTINSTKVTGVGTNWTTAGINPGATFRIDRQPFAYEIAEVVSDTELRLAAPYYGNSGTGLSYSIDRNFQSTLPSRMSADLASLISIYEQVRDGVYLTIEGKNAYEIAVANGYTGTVAQWLESLKAGGDWSALNTRTEILTYKNAGAHNALYRGKNLGNAFTEAQSAAIRAGTFDDIYPGDYWPITTTYTYYVATGDKTANKAKTYYADVNGTALATQPEEGADISEAGYYEAVTTTATVNWRIADLDYYLKCGDQNNGLTTHHIVVVPDVSLYTARMNATNTTEGGYVGSEMYTKNLARAKALITAAFGAGHILTHREYLTNAVTNGKPSGGAWLNSTVELMTEQMVYGGRIRAAGNNAEETTPTLATVSKSQLSLFRFRPDLMIAGSGANRWWYWLRDVVNGLGFAFVGTLGYASYTNASYSGGGVRPAALIY